MNGRLLGAAALVCLAAACSEKRRPARAVAVTPPASPGPTVGTNGESQMALLGVGSAPVAGAGHFLHPGHDVRSPAFSHDGRWIAFVSNIHIVDGGEATNLESGNPKLYRALERARHDGEARDPDFLAPVLVVIDAATGADVARLGHTSDFAISPDDKTIAYVPLAKRTDTIRVFDVANRSERSISVPDGHVVGLAYLSDRELVYRQSETATTRHDGTTTELTERLVRLDLATDARTVIFRSTPERKLGEFAACNGRIRALVEDSKPSTTNYRVLEFDRGVRVLADFRDCVGCAHRPIPWPNAAPLCSSDYIAKQLGEGSNSRVVDVRTADGRRRLVMQLPEPPTNHDAEPLTVKSGTWLNEVLTKEITVPGVVVWSDDGRHVAVTSSVLGTFQPGVFQDHLRWWTVPPEAK